MNPAPSGVVCVRACPPTLGRASNAGLALLVLTGEPDAIDAVLDEACEAALETGRVSHREIASADDGVVARVSPREAHLCLHAGAYAVRAVEDRLRQLGVEVAEPSAAPSIDPGDFEGALDHALASARCRVAVELLEQQPRLWSEAGLLGAGRVTRPPTTAELDRAGVLRHVLAPARIVAVGLANAGKSTLLNALAKRSVSVVADEAGTTRDHVGVWLDLQGFRVHWIDTPGVLEDPTGLDARALDRAAGQVSHADLVIACVPADAAGAAEGLDAVLAAFPDIAPDRVLPCLTKADLADPAWADPAWVRTAAAAGSGVESLVSRVRERIAPEPAFQSDEPWWFYPALDPRPRSG